MVMSNNLNYIKQCLIANTKIRRILNSVARKSKYKSPRNHIYTSAHVSDLTLNISSSFWSSGTKTEEGAGKGNNSCIYLINIL